MNESLQKAIECLKIHDVYLRSSEATLTDGFEPKYETDLDALEVQFKHLVSHSNVLLLEEDGESKLQLFRVFVELGARWVESTEQKSGDDDSFKAQIEAVMVAEYLMKEDPGKEALKEFALRNASYHIWPYWREYLTTQCMRMNLPKLVMPTVQFANNRDTD